MNTQKQLINAAMLASARKMKAARRAKAGESSTHRSGFPTAPTSTVLNAAAPENSPKRSRESSEVNIELNMPDEERTHTLFMSDHHCTKCGSQHAKLHVEFEAYRKYYRVECSSIMCGHTTQMFEKSQDAIAVWKMQSLLSKP